MITMLVAYATFMILTSLSKSINSIVPNGVFVSAYEVNSKQLRAYLGVGEVVCLVTSSVSNQQLAPAGE